jgi:hypothetical protein
MIDPLSRLPSLIQKLLLFVVILLPSLSPGADFVMNGYIDAGERTEGDDYTEEDDDSEYRYTLDLNTGYRDAHGTGSDHT